MKKIGLISFTFLSLGSAIAVNLPVRAQNNTFTGSVERVWEDGFILRTNERSITVDSWDVCGDNTTQHISVGDRLVVSGEFDEGEFDAFSITNNNNEKLC